MWSPTGRTRQFPTCLQQTTEAEWDAWLEFVRDLNYPRMVPRKLLLAGIVFGVPIGLYQAMTHEQERSPFIEFLWGLAFSVGVCSLAAFLILRYWVFLCRGWQQGPTETRVFKDGVFFHHKFIDWKNCPDKAVAAEVESVDTPIATLVVKVSGTGNGLAPQINFVAPIPKGQLEAASDLACALSQNVNWEDGKKENTITG